MTQQYDYGKLQNGSDIRGVALDGIDGEEINLDMEAAEKIAKGFLFWLVNTTEKKAETLTISIGRDPRLSGPALEEAFVQALLPYGVQILTAGISSTPAMFMSTVFEDYKCDGGVMITASHLPFNRNGFKFFDSDGGLNKGDIADIISFAESNSILGRLIPCVAKPVQKIPLLDTYSAHLRQIIVNHVDNALNGSLPLDGIKIVVDAGNGSAGFYAEKVLAPLGADVSSSQFLSPDGSFPNHAPNPENKQAMKSICDKVKVSSADLGLIFDTDVDRSSAVDEHGREISRNGIVAMAAALIAKEHPHTTVVTDSITSDQLSQFLTSKLGLRHLRYKRGYKNVINKAISLNQSGTDSQLAIETSGHGAYKENFFLDDGAYLATKIVIAAANLKHCGLGISYLISDLQKPEDAMEIRIPISDPDFSAYGDRIISGLTEWVSMNELEIGCHLVEPNYEGVRIAFDNQSVKGWCLLRKSLHDPIMPLNIESDSTDGCKIILDYIKVPLSQYRNLNIKSCIE